MSARLQSPAASAILRAMAKTSKSRADQLMVTRGLAESRSRAQALIMAGQVYSGDRRIDKPGLGLAADTPLSVKGQDHPWVSRGGLKLAHALDHFAIDPAGCVCLDVGASTGGFTDVLLAGGAARVYAVDVGHGQLAWKLRQDERVVVLEKTNARYLGRDEVPEPVSIIVCDTSFIGLATVLPAPLALAAPGARLVALIKPQFEVGKARVEKGGVVRDDRRLARRTSRLAGPRSDREPGPRPRGQPGIFDYG
jgi:23S rRNA (cytidine1920-2'-O)/16S rRNA (cytidine1409-2'-O)-methyltransferase